MLDEVYPEEVPLLLERIVERKKTEALEQISHWSMLLDIAVAPHIKDGAGVRSVTEQLQKLKRTIEQGAQAAPEVDFEFHRKLVDLNKRRRERRAG